MFNADDISRSARLRPHSVQVALSHHAPPYLGEEYPITVEVTNADDRELEIVADAMLHPSEVEYAGQYLGTCLITSLKPYRHAL